MKKLDPKGSIPVWFVSLVKFIIEDGLSNSMLLSLHSILTDSSCDFGYVGKCLLNSRLGSITIYTDSFIKNLGLLVAHSSATTYFLNVNTSVGVKIDGLLSSILVKLQAITLVLDQALLDLCKSAGSMVGSDFCNKCWIKKEHICCVISKKDLSITWNKIKDYSGIVGNKRANFYANAAVVSEFFLSLVVFYHFFNVEGKSARCVSSIISVSLSDCFNKAKTFCVWHSDNRIRSGYTSPMSIIFWSYFMKAFYHYLPCGLVEDSDYVFFCICDLLGTSADGNMITNLLNKTAFSIDLFTVLAKSFVLKSWVVDTLGHLGVDFGRGALVVNFIYCFAESYRSAIWLSMAKLRSYYKKYNLLSCDGSSIFSVSDLSLLWSVGMIQNFKAAPGGSMLNKKALIGAFFGSTAALAKPHSKENQYSDMESDFGDSVAGDILAGGGDGSLFGSAAMTSKAKRIKSNLDCSSPFGSLNYNIDNDDSGLLPPPLGISLDRIWLDPKIIKTQVKVAVKKSFVLDVNISNMEGKLVTIIRSTFTSEENMKKAALLVGENGIIVNTNLKKQGVCSDQAVIIKKIPMDMQKELIITVVSEYDQIVSIKVQLIGLWQKAVSFLIGKNSVHVVKAVEDCKTWAFRDQFRVLLFTLPVETTAYDLGTLLEGAGGKTCVINHSLETGNRTHCAVVCFESDEAMESAFCTEPIFGGVKLSWTRLDLVHCKWCGKFGHSALECDARVASLAKLYAKKKVLISHSVAFGGKSWAQVVSVASASHGSHDSFGSGSLLFGASCSGDNPPPLFMVNSPLGTCLACLECFVELLSDRILNILLHLDNLSLVSLAPSSSVIPSVGTSHPSISDSFMIADSDLGSNMMLDVLTSKVGVLELKLVALDASIGSILAKLEQMCAGLDPLVLFSSQ
ncbi:hypothetical protein G9A89_000096 [Geosiphon pyriformis]|nr:hypothetical protein G9A89_000096 [Geosiphon pyriformis]